MAYNQKNLSMASHGVIDHLRDFTYYTTTDDIATVEAAGYISDAEDNGMRVGDVVRVRATDGTGIRQCTALSATGGATLGALS